MTKINPRFMGGYEAIKALSKYPRYEGAFIFGSVAEGTAVDKSDLDVKVVVDKDNACEKVNHPMLDGYKFDISFSSFRQLKEYIEKDLAKKERRSILATAVIVFDKTGQLTALQKKTQSARAKKLTKTDFLYAQFMLYHANDKVERYLEDDPASALYSMHANIGDVLKYHYQLHGQWWVSSKKLLGDLEAWDGELAQLVKSFVSTADVKEKYGYWLDIMNYVTAPMGGRKPIAENNCSCDVCKADLAALVQNIRD